jgi:hypothetical protein
MTPRRSQRIQKVREGTPDIEESSELKIRGPRSMAKSRSKLNKTAPAEMTDVDEVKKILMSTQDEQLKQVEKSNVVEADVSLLKSLVRSVESDLHFFFVLFLRR